MSNPFVRAAFLVVIAALVSFAQDGQQQPNDDQTTAHDKNAQYLIEKQPPRCTTGKGCPDATGEVRGPEQPRPIWDPPKPEKVPEVPQTEKKSLSNVPPASPASALGYGSGAKRAPEVPQKEEEPLSNVPPTHPASVPGYGSGAKKDGTPQGTDTINDGDKDRDGNALPLTEGIGPVRAIVFVGVGSLVGLAASVAFLNLRFAKKRATRPYGDLSRLRLQDKDPVSQPWQAVEDPTVFQFESALRRKLITQEEFRDLQSKYLIAGNFTFSMLFPMLLALVILTTGTGAWYQWIAVSATGALLTAALTTYAIDQRHQFRSEYRTLIIRNLRQMTGPRLGVSTAPTDEYSSWADDLVEAAIRMVYLAARSRRPATERGREKEDL
jgi:hypothetical protein